VLEDDVDHLHTDETREAREARRLLATAFETVPADPATTGELRGVRRRYARRRRTRALVSAVGAAAAAGAAATLLLAVAAAGAPPALAAVSRALSKVSAESFRMNLKVTQHDTRPGQGGIKSPLYITGELDLKRGLGNETLSNGRQTRIVGGEAYTELRPAQAKQSGTGGKLWTQASLSGNEPPYRSAAAQLAWDFNSDRPFNPQALLALLKSGAKVVDQGPVSGLGWTGTRYRFTLSHPQGTGGVVDYLTCTVDVDGQGHVRSLIQSIGFAAGGHPGAAAGQIDTLDFAFSSFGVRFSVARPPARQIDRDLGVAVQF
jgi:hypothetical protein